MSESVRERVLAAVRNQDITFLYAGSRVHLSWWLSEREKRRLTAAERRTLNELVVDGTIRQVHGYRFGRGGYELAPRKVRP